MVEQPDKRLKGKLSRQLLSRCHDGDLDSEACHRLLDTLAQNDALRATWERYQLIGQAIRGESLQPSARRLAANVHAALAAVPTSSKPRRIDHFTMQSLVRAMQWRRFGWLAGVAMTAGLAAMAVLMLPRFGADSALQPHTLAAQPGAVAGAEGVSGFAPIQAQVWSRRSRNGQWQPKHEAVAVRLDRLLMAHQAATAQPGPRGMLSHAAFASDQPPR